MATSDIPQGYAEPCPFVICVGHVLTLYPSNRTQNSDKEMTRPTYREQHGLMPTYYAPQLSAYLGELHRHELVSQGLASQPADMSAQMSEWQRQWYLATARTSDETESNKQNSQS